MGYSYAGQWGPEAIIDLLGNVQSGTQVTLLQTDGVTKATRYTDRTKATPTTNPWNADVRGEVSLFADPGSYILRVQTGSGSVDKAITVPVDPVDAMFGIIPRRLKADKTVINTNVAPNYPTDLQNDIGATETWFFRGWFRFLADASGTTEDASIWVKGPTGAVVTWLFTPREGDFTSNTPSTPALATGPSAAVLGCGLRSSGETLVSFEGEVIGGGTAGTVQVGFTQNTPTNVTLTLVAGSWMFWTKETPLG